MRVTITFSAIRQMKWHQFALRFIFGGFVTTLAGVVAMQFGPIIGGLFLAFPAIFPASITLVQNHETEKKEKSGMNGAQRGRYAAAAEAAGAAMGSLGLLIFGVIVWQFAPHYVPWMVLTGATIAWFTVAFLIWEIRKRL